jgi:hemerythrin
MVGWTIRVFIMALIEWKEEYSVRVASIDDQHMRLISIINRLHDSMKEGKGWEILSGILDELKDYSNYHFMTEEALMQKVSYPLMDRHIAEHDHFRSRIRDISDQVKEGNFVMTLETNTFLKEWLVSHVTGTDRRYIERFVIYGIK